MPHRDSCPRFLALFRRLTIRRTMSNSTSIKMDIQEIGLREGGGVNWIDLALDKEKRRVLVNTVMNFPFP